MFKGRFGSRSLMLRACSMLASTQTTRPLIILRVKAPSALGPAHVERSPELSVRVEAFESSAFRLAGKSVRFSANRDARTMARMGALRILLPHLFVKWLPQKRTKLEAAKLH